ncbi:MAG: arginine--tRNA ligase [Selenomonadaceae bacterium]|nr:arginine--tRNA ligase [Selenomonadaceae bacterium]
MDMKEKLCAVILAAAEQGIADGVFPEAEIPAVELEVPPKKELGDFATNFAMKSARAFHKSPRQIAEALAERFSRDGIDRVEIAGPGFINFYLTQDVIYESLRTAIAAGENYGNLPKKDAAKIQVEYVSANPTGPLHVGHGRGAAVGSALVNLLRAAGYDVEAEYYINDAGNQIDHLAESVNARYLQLCGQNVEVPEDGYRGQDIVETARRIKEKDGDIYLSMPEAERLSIFKERALAEKLAALKEDLAAFNVKYDVWFSERTLHPDKVNAAVEKLRANGNIYEKDGALWLRSTDYGDDKDRVVIRAGGEPTYLAADIAYHKDKFERGFGRVINLWGADHHGYICRVKAAIQAMGGNPDKLTVMLLQMVSLLRGGEAVKMSKRTGESVTLAELIEEVGTDAARYFFVMRSPDSQLDFDIDLAKSQSSENPVYYVQYAHARIRSVFRQAEETGLSKSDAFELLTDESELALIKKIEEYPREVEKAAADLAPQRIARVAHEMASAFHSFYSRCRIMGVEPKLAGARLALAGMTAQVIRHALGILGVSAPEKM